MSVENMEEEKKEEYLGSYSDPDNGAGSDEGAPKKSLTEPLGKSQPQLKQIHKVTSKLPMSIWGELGRFLLSLGTFSAQSVLFICFLALVVVYCLRTIHDDYFVTVVERARRTDDDLLEEYTYYNRECNVADITAGLEDAKDLYIQADSKNHGVDQMMKHGAVLFPDLLSPETVSELRKFIVAKNDAVKGTAAEFPMSQGYRRISYGIEGTEDPSVVRALKEIHDNVELKHLLEGLIGKNPALTEITAITASYGCRAQAWHPDTKPDGNGVLFGRTYSHSYSLFMPLQNTTGKMGATDYCPGTHYCSTEELHTVCDEVKIGMHQVSGEGYWPAGSATLLNQQVWHRGGMHSDPHAGDRVVFIVSFLARPNDTRQLSRGTYFHMKWNMWGHTWADLADSMKFMSWPWNIFTCLHIWRPVSHGWGYDLITASAMRIANNQLGCQPDDLERFLAVLDNVGFPTWLDGTIDFDHKEAWQIYLRETLANCWDFLLMINKYALGGYFALVGLATLTQLLRGRSASRALWGGTKGVVLSHVVVVILAAEVMHYVHNAPWAKELSSGRMLMRPFPPVKETLEKDPAVSAGPTTLPHRRDVLLGGRMDARTIGAYNRWFEFHPGNEELLRGIIAMGGNLIYRSYVKGLPPAFAQAVINATMEPILSRGGRFLQQDYRTGDWLYMKPNERDSFVEQALYIGAEGPLSELRKELDFVLGDARFGYSRHTAMAKRSLAFLRDLEGKLFGRFSSSTPISKVESGDMVGVIVQKPFFSILNPLSSTSASFRKVRNWTFRWTEKPLYKPAFMIGEEVMYKVLRRDTEEVEDMAKATVVKVHSNGKLDIAFYEDWAGSFGTLRTVSQLRVEKITSVHAGSFVWANFKDQGDWYRARIAFMSPNGYADIAFADGDFEENVPPERYTPTRFGLGARFS